MFLFYSFYYFVNKHIYISPNTNDQYNRLYKKWMKAYFYYSIGSFLINYIRKCISNVYMIIMATNMFD